MRLAFADRAPLYCFTVFPLSFFFFLSSPHSLDGWECARFQAQQQIVDNADSSDADRADAYREQLRELHFYRATSPGVSVRFLFPSLPTFPHRVRRYCPL